MKTNNKDIDKKIKKIKKKIQDIKVTKIKATNITTLKELKEVEKRNRTEEIIYSIQAFLKAKKGGRGIISLYADATNLSRQTFVKYAECYEKNERLPLHGNLNKEPWNKTNEFTILEVVKMTSKIINKVEKYANEPVPTLIPLLFNIVKEEFDKKHPEIKISLSTYKRILGGSDFQANLKYETKIGRKLRRKLKKLNNDLAELELIKNNVNIELKEKAEAKQILADDKTKEEEKEKVSKRRNESLPGEILQWDGSLDQFKNNKRITRMQVIDHNTLATMALFFVENENNYGFQMAISQIIDHYGIPLMILGDFRKGVDPRDEGALNAIVCKLLGITLWLDSNSTHKTELESLNGKMHPFVTYNCALKKITTISQLNKQNRELVKESNEYFKRPKADYSHLRQASEEVKEILRGKITQVYIKSSDGIIFKKNAYQAYNNNKLVDLDRFTWTIVAIEEGYPTKIWTDKGIFTLRKIANKMKIKMINTEKIFEMTEKHFIDNGVMILNRPTYELLTKEILKLGKKAAIKNKSWQVDKQIAEKIKRKKEI